jgi:ribosomal protein S1/(E)-4-hydroxy-3-methyl-but-2-enyl pyrophosphate reductase
LIVRKRRAVFIKIQRAEKAGFCFGVKRAIELAEQAAAKRETASLGPLIHNQQVVGYLEKKGIRNVDSVDEVQEGQLLVIRSHGVPPDIYSEIEKRKIECVDATCPYVQKAQRLAKELSQTHFVIVVGDRNHPEVKGILGWAGENSLAVETLEEAQKLPYYRNLGVLAQTTQEQEKFSLITEELRRHTDNFIVYNTICRATKERQASARELSQKVDIMIVVGGRNSSNTRKLGEICSQTAKTYTVETAAELQKISFQGAKSVGLTAGASTPDWIIEEVYNKMSELVGNANEVLMEEKDVAREEKEENATLEENNENTQLEQENDVQTMENFDGELPMIYGGAIVTGKVVKITDEEVFVDIGWKSEGLIPIEELAATRVLDVNDVVKIGDTISAMVTRVENKEGYTVLSRKRVAEIEARKRLAELAESQEETQAKVTEAVKGGLLVDMGMRGFVPASHIELGFVSDLTKYVGKTLRLKVIEYDEAKKKLILSQKVILEEEQAAKREKLLEELKEGDVVKGIVRRLTNFGAFIDLGGLDGLLHVSEMSFSRVARPSDVVQVDDEIEVQVLNVDKERGRVSLSLKQLLPDPWDSVGEKYPVGSIVEGKEVVRIATFGAFVKLEDGVDALVHISQLADYRVGKVEEVVNVGDIIRAKVIECKPEDKRISLSIKEAQAEAQKAEEREALANQAEEPLGTLGDTLENISSNEEE